MIKTNYDKLFSKNLWTDKRSDHLYHHVWWSGPHASPQIQVWHLNLRAQEVTKRHLGGLHAARLALLCTHAPAEALVCLQLKTKQCIQYRPGMCKRHDRANNNITRRHKDGMSTSVPRDVMRWWVMDDGDIATCRDSVGRSFSSDTTSPLSRLISAMFLLLFLRSYFNYFINLSIISYI